MIIRKILTHRFALATFWMVIASNFLNFGNYLYHLIMGRFLGPGNYGILESLISLLYIFSIPLMTITLVIVKFSSVYKGKKDYKAIAGLYKFLNRKFIVYGLLFSIIFIVFSPLIMNFLHIDAPYLMVVLAITFFVGPFNMLTKSILQGLTDFKSLAFANLAEVLVKLLVAVVLVILGLKIFGAITAFVAGIAAGYLVALKFLRNITKLQGEFVEQKNFLAFSVPVFLSNLGFISLFTTDILLVRHFFPGVESGYYAALSVLGKIIFFAASPIALVMFPFVSEHHVAKKGYTHFLFWSLTLTTIVVSSLTLIYFLFPKIMVVLLFGKDYLEIVPLLGIFAIFITLYTLSSLFANFYLSIKKTRVIAVVVIAAILQILLIWFYHTTLLEVIKVSIIVSLLLLFSLVLYYPYAKDKA